MVDRNNAKSVQTNCLNCSILFKVSLRIIATAWHYCLKWRIFTVRIRRVGEDNSFSLIVSSHPVAGTPARSRWGARGYPGQVQMWATLARSRRGVPWLGPDWGYPSQVQMGVLWPRMRYPPSRGGVTPWIAQQMEYLIRGWAVCLLRSRRRTFLLQN